MPRDEGAIDYLVLISFWGDSEMVRLLKPMLAVAAAILMIVLLPLYSEAPPTSALDFRTIQRAINAATDGDVVLVAPGTYMEYDIRFHGKAINVKSRAGPEVTIIDGTILATS